MKNWFVIFLIGFNVAISNADIGKAQLYHVKVETLRGPKIFDVYAPSDSYALDSVFVGLIYNKKFPRPLNAEVIETGLSTQTIPVKYFEVITETHSYFLSLHTLNVGYAMTVIQASKYLMSDYPVREIYASFDHTKLKSKPAHKYTLKFKSREITYLLNTDNVDEGRMAIDLAAKISSQAKEYLGVKIPNFNCGKMFAN